MLTEKQKRLCMNVHEVAEELGVSEPTAYEIVNRQDFPSIKHGKRIIVPREAFEKWLMDTVSGGQAVLKERASAR